MQFVEIDELASHVRPTSRFKNSAAVIDLRKAGVPVGLQNAGEVFEMSLRMLAFAIGRYRQTTTAGATSPAAGRSSRTYVHRRPVLVLPRPGASTGIGVSSACTTSAAKTCARSASVNGVSNALTVSNPLCQQRAVEFHALARVDLRLPIERNDDRRICRPARAPGGRDQPCRVGSGALGAGACTIVSQHAQANFGTYQ